MYDINDKDQGLSANLNKAPKLSYKALHPRNNKQSVPLALAIIHETTTAAARSYFPTRSNLSGFLNLINTWWTIYNSKQRYMPTVLGNAITFGEKKTDFYRIFADWIELWKLPYQTKSALVTSLRAESDLIDKLIDDGYKFVRFQNFKVIPLKDVFHNIGK